MAVLKAKYEKAAAVPGYQKLLKTCPVLATWDDHDYGKNDAGVEYPQKDQSQQLFLDFYGIPKDSPRRTQKGVYDSVTYGPEGKRVQIIVLDLRYFRSPLKRGKRADTAALIDEMMHFGIGFSWGGFESLILPVSIGPTRSVTRPTWSGPVVRLSIGLEHPDDLIADLAAGLQRYEAQF